MEAVALLDRHAREAMDLKRKLVTETAVLSGARPACEHPGPRSHTRMATQVVENCERCGAALRQRAA